MCMKRISTLLLFLLTLLTGYAQNPFATYGYKPQMATLSNGRFDEFHDKDQIIEIGSVKFDTKTNKIVGPAESDTLDTVMDIQTVSRFISIDPHAERYYSISPYAYCANNPVKFIDPDGKVIRLANNYAGGMENIAKIAATSLGSQVMSHLISRKETYTLNSTFWSSSSSYDPTNRDINYVGNPWYSEIPYDGGALNSMVAMGHESFHAFDHSYNLFNSANAGYSRDLVEPRAVSFGNYLRSTYSLSPLREQYGYIKGNFHQFGGNEKISDFATLGNNSDKTSYGFSYTKTTTIVESYKKNFLGLRVPDKTRKETTTHYMTVSRDKNNNVSFQTYNSEEEYRNATSNW